MGFPDFNDSAAAPVRSKLKPKSKNIGCGTGCLWLVVALFGLGIVGQLFRDPNRALPTNQPVAGTTARPAVEQRAIEVESLIVKLVEGTFRYFFRIVNNDRKPFEGDVSIAVLSGWGIIPDEEKAFATTSPIAPGNARVVYFDCSVGPKTRQRDKPIEKFSFEAFVAGQSVAKGRGPITAKFERISD